MNRLWISLIFLPLAASAQEEAPPKAIPVPQPAIQNGMVEVNGFAAKVNGRLITKKEVGVLLSPAVSQLMAAYPRRGPEFERQLNENRDKVVQELIDREIIMSEFKKLEQKGAAMPEKAVDQEIQNQIRNLYNGNESKFREELAKARVGMASYREMTREKLIVQAMRQEKFKDVVPPLPGEVAQEYAETKDLIRDTSKDVITYRKIFLPRLDPQNPLATPETQLALSESLVDELRKGADFAELAQKHSQDAFASEGGLQSDVPRPDLSPEFAAILFDGKDGEVLGPLEDPAGFTIAKIESIQKGPSPPLSEVRESMEARVRAKKSSENYEKWIKNLREQAMIEVLIK